MPTEPRQVDIVPVVGCGKCAFAGRFIRSAKIDPSSLTARMLDLAEAVDRWQGARDVISYDEGLPEFYAALAAVRSHEDYRRPE